MMNFQKPLQKSINMKKNLFLALVLITCFGTPSLSHAGFWDSVQGMIWGTHSMTSPKIDVLLYNDQPGVMLDVQGRYKLYDPHTNKHLGTRFVGKKKLIQGIANGLKWGEEFPGIYQVQVVPDDPMTKIIVNGVEYPGSLFIYDVGGAVSIVNQVDLEDYLICTLSKQHYDPLPEETFASVAIVARTFAYYESQNPKNNYWAVDAQQVGYQGNTDVDTKSHIGRAIQVTNGMVLSQTGAYEGMVTPIAAQWGPSSGSQSTKHQGVYSRISLFDADELGRNGKDASSILSKAFPDAHIELVR
jgi:stage II sporulation protein D